MTPPVCIKRYLGAYQQFAQLADWLRDQRAGKYAEMVARGTMTEAEAYVDERARASIARDWQAIAADAPREPDPSGMAVMTHWKIRALEGAVAGVESRLARIAERDPCWADWRDLRDATAALLHYERLTVSLLCLQEFNREQRRKHARPEDMAA